MVDGNGFGSMDSSSSSGANRRGNRVANHDKEKSKLNHRFPKLVQKKTLLGRTTIEVMGRPILEAMARGMSDVGEMNLI